SHIANNRLKVLPNDHSVLFFNDDMQTALKMAKQVEAIAFSLLNRFIKWDEPVQKALSEDILQVFGSIRALNEQVALQLVQIFAGLPNEMPATFAPLFFYFAEFR